MKNVDSKIVLEGNIYSMCWSRKYRKKKINAIYIFFF